MTDDHQTNTTEKVQYNPSLWIAVIPVIALVALISSSVLLLGQSAHIALILACAVAAIVARSYGVKWEVLEQGMLQGIGLGLKACLVLMIIGTLIGTWILSGIVPTMIYYGLSLISPTYFLVTCCIICSFVSLSTGSSWSTAGTVGLAFIGIGEALGIPLPMVAGAIVSGAYFGDKMSPLSDTTNLAPATTGTELFTHIRHMLYTTTPSLLISLIIYLFLGFQYQAESMQMDKVTSMLATIKTQFVIHPLLLLPALLVIVMVIMRIPALPALLGGSLLGGLVAMLVQDSSLATVMEVAFRGFSSHSGVAAVDQLLSRGGMTAMLETIALIFCALSFGGIMEHSGMLHSIARAALKLAVNTGTLVTTTIVTCIGFNLLSADQYVSIVIPGRMYKDAFLQRNLHPKNLSRCLEDSATLSSPLIPWNTCGAFMAAALGVNPFAFLPYAFLNLINPLISIFYGFTGISMHPYVQSDSASAAALASSSEFK